MMKIAHLVVFFLALLCVAFVASAAPVPIVAGVPLGGIGTNLGSACHTGDGAKPSAAHARQTADLLKAKMKAWQTKTLLNALKK